MKRSIIILGVFFVGLFLYYMYCVVDTRPIMKEMQDVNNGKQVSEDDPLSVFQQNETYQVVNIKRNFTFCLGKKGCIWVSMQYKIIDSKGEIVIVNDSCKLIIQKKQGKWKVIKYVNRP